LAGCGRVLDEVIGEQFVDRLDVTTTEHLVIEMLVELLEILSLHGYLP
jgi:hypothetical protein